MNKYISTILLLCTVLLTQAQQLGPFRAEQASGYHGKPILGLQYEEDSFSFVVLGDFGRVGNYYQKDVAREMGHAVVGLDAEFVVSVGDNFYPNGVQSINDYHWISSYEQIYTDPSLYTDWYVALGNHDYRGNVQAQIDYSKVSRRWHMPDRYYSNTFTLDNGDKLLLVVMDTNPYIAGYHQDTAKYPDLTKQDTVAQSEWLIRELGQHDPAIKWKIVVGHHPLYSGGKRKESEDTQQFAARFADVFDQYRVDAYICGHEHDLQIIKPAGRHTVQFLSGSASEVRPSGAREGTIFAAAEPGFMSFSISGNKMLVQTIRANSKGARVLHKYEWMK